MKGADRRKVVTSGRLTGGVKVQAARKRVAPNPAPAACPEPAYSLYSTDSEDQVTTLHKGLDRCAALLSGILQAEKAASPSFPRAATGGVAKSRPSTSLGKKSIKKMPAKTAAPVQKSFQSGQCGAGTTTPRTSHRSTTPAAHSGVKLHPHRKQPHSLLHHHHTTHSHSKTLCPLKTPSPVSQTSALPLQTQPSVLLSVIQSSSQLSVHQSEADAECDGGDEDFVPVRDINTQSTVTDTHTGAHLHACTMKMSNMQLEPGQGSEVPQTEGSAETDVKVKTVQYLLGELKALIAGQGSVAEVLLSHLEQTVSSPQMNDGSSIIQTVPELSSLYSQNTQLRRCVRVLEQQLKEKERAERQQNMETLFNSEVSTLHEELTAAQSRLQELQDDLAELREALRDTQRQLSDREVENRAIKTDLESTRNRLVEIEREKNELAAVAQQRLEEIENLNRILQSQDSSECATVIGSVSDSQLTIQQQHREHQAGPPTDHITHYLLSLDQPDPAEHVRMAAEREGNPAEQRRDASPHTDVTSQRVDKLAEASNPHLAQLCCLDKVQPCGRWMGNERGGLLDLTLSHCDVESVRSEWSMRSDSTFNTRDEAAFREGLAALDARIASLQKTVQLDLMR